MCIFSAARPLAFTTVGFSATHNITHQSRKSDIDTAKTVGKNTLVLFVSPIASMGLRFFYLISSGRYLGPDFFGLLTFAYVFTGIFGRHDVC